MKRRRASGASHPVSTVSVRLKRLGQLFNSLDPSPFRDRDLDKEAAEFIETEFRDKPRDHGWVLNLTALDGESFSEHDVQEAVRHYYQRSVESMRQRTAERYRIGRLALALGLGVFLACMFGRQLLHDTVAGGGPSVLDEGLIVLAWIALWLPIEHFVYDIAPLIRERRFLERLVRLRVHVRMEKASDQTLVASQVQSAA
jgi:hypothetical protein